ncbi:MAG: alpha-E domain-containing protein [Beijerinckiaceae bacterium]
MLSRMADSVYWLSRYIERAENLSRILDVAQRLAALPSAYAGTANEWSSALATAACTDLYDQTHDKVTREAVIQFIVAGENNPSSIRACVETARANARAVRTALTSEMWEVINGLWHDVQKFRKKDLDPNQLAKFLAVVQEGSLRFDGAAYRTMLRTDHFRFQRLGTFIERADNIARLLDVKYHLLLPENEPVGGGLDYFQWSAILRSVGALTSYNWIYRDNVRPWLVADFLILRPEQPRSLVSSYDNLNYHLNLLAEQYGRQGPSQRIARATYGGLQNQEIEALFQSGLHEFLTSFTADNNRLGAAIHTQYLA